MEIKIRHYNKSLGILFFASLAFGFFAVLVRIYALEIAAVLFLNAALLFMLLSGIMKTKLIIGEDSLRVQYFFLGYEIPLADIRSVTFRHTEQLVKGYKVYRVVMDITTAGKTYTLSDNATTYPRTLLLPGEPLPDDDVPLYSAYTVLTEQYQINGKIK